MNILMVRLRASFRWQPACMWPPVWIMCMVFLWSTGCAVATKLSLVLLSLCVFPVIALFGHMSSLQKDFFGKPLSFCLPRYRRNIRRIFFVDALPYVLFVPLFLYHFMSLTVPEETGLLERCLGVFGVLVVVMALVFSGGLRFFLSRIELSLLVLLRIPLCILGYIMLARAFEHPLVLWPVVISVCVIYSYFVCRGLGDMERVKGAHRRFVLASVEQCADDGGGKAVLPEVEAFFLSRMKRYGYMHTGRYVWGGLYRAFGLIPSYWRWIFVSVLCSVLVVGYAGKVLQELIFVALGLLAFIIHLPLTSDMLLPEGRRERYYSAVASACATMVIATAAAAAVACLSMVFAFFMPEIARYGLHYTGIRPATVYLACLLTPGLFAFKLLAYRMPILAKMSVYAVTILLVVAIICLDSEVSVLPRSTGPVLFASVFFSGCAFFLLILWRVCAKWCLTKEDRWKAL